MKPDMTGEDIKRARQTAEWNQATLAKRLGVNVSTISRYEAGATIPQAIVIALRKVFDDARVSIG